SLAAVQEAFVALMRQQIGAKITIVNKDDPLSQPLLAHKGGEVITYGVSPLSTYRIEKISFSPEKVMCELTYKENLIGKFVLKVPGNHNVHNATAAAIA